MKLEPKTVGLIRITSLGGTSVSFSLLTRSRTYLIVQQPKRMYVEWNLSGYMRDVKIMGIRDVSLPGERDLWLDLEFCSESVVRLSFVYVGHLTFKFSPSKTAPIAPKMHTRDKHKVNSR